MRPFVRSIPIAGAVVLALWASAPALAGQSAGTAKVDVVGALSLIRTQDLLFGNAIAGATAGNVVVSDTGVRTRTGGVTLAGGIFQPAEFAGRGTRNQHITITFGAPSIVITRSGGGATMTVDTFTIIMPADGSLAVNGPRWRITPANGIYSFLIGATLHVGVNQASGNYLGTFAVTANYQ
jgi:Domain of unknown function (DUF4402)